MNPINYSYNQEADVLYISFAVGEKPTTAVELNDHMLLRFNRSERRAIGLTLMEFSVLVQLTRFGPRSFPLSGLDNLDSAWQEVVMELLTTPPVNQILRVSLYTPSLSETIPIALVEPMTVAV